jgi:Zn-dependent protease/predicted transcriptional regulator
MKWSYKIGRIAGIDVFLHATFLLLMVWLFIQRSMGGGGWRAGLGEVLLVSVLFGIVVLHELGHALTARRFGIRTASITLLPIGGVAALERIPEDPIQELLVALAGPAVNVALATLVFLGMAISGHAPDVLAASGSLWAQLFWVNVVLTVFNLVPAFPMDGGRVLRALLSLRVDRVKATRIAAGIGQAIAVVFAFVGLISNPVNPILVFVGVFVWLGAEGESQQVRFEAETKGLTVGDVMARDFHIAERTDILEDVASLVIPSFQSDVPILDGLRVLGFVSIADVARGLAAAGPKAPVVDFMQDCLLVTSPERPLGEVISRWQSAGTSAVAVMENDLLVGILTAALVGEHLMLLSALRSTPTVATENESSLLPIWGGNSHRTQGPTGR